MPLFSVQQQHLLEHSLFNPLIFKVYSMYRVYIPGIHPREHIDLYALKGAWRG